MGNREGNVPSLPGPVWAHPLFSFAPPESPCYAFLLTSPYKYVYSIDMNSLGSILGSAARTDILRALHHQSEPVGLRHLAMLAGVQLRSAQLALAGLETDRLVSRYQSATRALFVFNPQHEAAPVLGAIFAAADRAVHASRRGALDARAQTLLPFIAEASRMIQHAREEPHVS